MRDWHHILRTNFTKVEELGPFLHWEPSLYKQIIPHPHFRLNLPYRLAAKVEKNTLEDPLLKQFLPLASEKETPRGFSLDPVQETLFKRTDKLLHKYEGRALLITTSSCAMNCRFCFRRNFDYEKENKSWDREIQLIEDDISLKEIILSGGDPLSLSDTTLFHLLDRLEKIPQVQKVRFHSRFPIGIPERIHPGLLAYLAQFSKQLIFVIHINHPKELDPEVIQALKSLLKCGIPLLSQTVLLKGVNDQVEILATLFETLTNCGIMPYYLHQLDRVQGASHFEVEEKKGLELIQALKKYLPGYSVPRYVQEIPGESSKYELTSLLGP